MSSRHTSREVVDDAHASRTSSETVRFGSRSSTNGRNSSLGFSHPTEHMYEEPAPKKNSRGSTKRKVISLDGVCFDGQSIHPIVGEAARDFSMQLSTSAESDPLSSLTSELAQIHGMPLQPAAKKKLGSSNFHIGTQSRQSDGPNPFKRRSLPDACIFRSVDNPTAKLPVGVSTKVVSSPPAAAKSSLFCERCGSSNVQPDFMSAGTDCLKTEVWGTRNVDEFTRGLNSTGPSLKCFTCFHVTN